MPIRAARRLKHTYMYISLWVQVHPHPGATSKVAVYEYMQVRMTSKPFTAIIHAARCQATHGPVRRGHGAIHGRKVYASSSFMIVMHGQVAGTHAQSCTLAHSLSRPSSWPAKLAIPVAMGQFLRTPYGCQLARCDHPTLPSLAIAPM